MPIRAADLQRLHGAELAVPPLSEARSPRILWNLLQQRRIAVSEQSVKTWWKAHRQSPDEAGIRVLSCEELDRVHGDCIRERNLAQSHPTAFLLCKALRQLEPPLLVSDSIAGRWLREYGGIIIKCKIDNAAHLELDWGGRIREHLAGAGIEPAALADWLRTLGVSVPARVCQAWLKRDWASSGAFLAPIAVEQQLGDKLRLDEYKPSFLDEAYDLLLCLSSIILRLEHL